MNYIDAALLNLTEWLCRRFQVLTGRTNVWLALQLTNLSIIVYFVWAALYFWSSDFTIRLAVGLFCGGVLYVLTQTVFKMSIEAYENEAYRRVAKGLRNPRRLRDARLRISFLTLCVVLFYPILFIYVNLHLHMALLTYSLAVLTTIVLYLLACDPLPPCAGRLTEWLGARKGSRAMASSRNIPAAPFPAERQRLKALPGGQTIDLIGDVFIPIGSQGPGANAPEAPAPRPKAARLGLGLGF